MNKLKNSILLLLLSALPYLISSQVPDRFEFLAHNAKRNIVSQIILKDDHIVFSTNKGLEKARFDYDIENLASVNSFMDIKKSKLVELNDSTYHFIYWGIEDADIPELPGFRFYSNRNGIVSSGSRGINDFNYINDITPDSTGGFWCLATEGEPLNSSISSKLLHYTSQGLNKEIEQVIFNARLYTNTYGEIFIYDPYVSHFNGEEHIGFSDLIFESANDIIIWGENNLILDGRRVHLTTPDFINRIHSWELPFSPRSFENISISKDSSIYVVDLQSTSYNIHLVDKESNDSLIYTSQPATNETIKGIKVLTDTTHIIYGQHQFEVSNNTFFRMIDHHEILEYEKRDVDLLRFGIEPLDTVQFGIPEVEGKVIIDYFNNGDSDVKDMNAISTSYANYNFISFLFNLNIPLTTDIQSQSSLRDFNIFYYSNEDFNGDLVDLSNLKIEIPGADYRFNESDNKVRTLDFLSVINNIWKTQQIQIFPNPTSNYITLNSPEFRNAMIFDVQGHLILNQDISTSQINVSQLVSGLYFVIFKANDNQFYTGKFIKK